MIQNHTQRWPAVGPTSSDVDQRRVNVLLSPQWPLTMLTTMISAPVSWCRFFPEIAGNPGTAHLIREHNSTLSFIQSQIAGIFAVFLFRKHHADVVKLPGD